MNLYFIRHAIAVDEGTEGYKDSERPLTDSGRKKMFQIAKGLMALGIKVDLIVSSPYVRARETSDTLADVFKVKQEIAFSENLAPSGDPDLLIAEINEKYSVDNLVIVGHEPSLSALTGLLIAKNAKMDMTYKKGGVCKLTAADLHHSRSATLEWLLTPKILVELSEK